MKSRLWMVLFAVAALGLAACGDANGDDDMAETDEAAQPMADDAADDAATDAGAAGDGATADDTVGDAGTAGEAGAGQELPEGVTMAMVDEGRTVYEGAGICSSCHGPQGEGIPNLGANLTDEEWIHSEGDYEGIVQTVMQGVTAEESTSGVPMPARAGTNISDEQVRAAAAYVWTLSR